MEELFNNFADHVSKLISPILGNRIKQYLYNKLQEENSPELYNEVENDIKILMTNYFQNATDKDFNDISTNLFNAYVENDDENFIKCIKTFIRIYSYYQELKLRKVLAKWRIKTIKLRINNRNRNYNNTKIINNTNFKDKSLQRNNSAGFTKLANKYGNNSYNNNKY